MRTLFSERHGKKCCVPLCLGTGYFRQPWHYKIVAAIRWQNHYFDLLSDCGLFAQYPCKSLFLQDLFFSHSCTRPVPSPQVFLALAASTSQVLLIHFTFLAFKMQHYSNNVGREKKGATLDCVPVCSCHSPGSGCWVVSSRPLIANTRLKIGSQSAAHRGTL